MHAATGSRNPKMGLTEKKDNTAEANKNSRECNL